MISEPIIQDRLLFPEILAKRPKNAHKRTCGRVLVVAGSRKMTGAAALVCRAAMRAGAGLVTLAFPEKLTNVYRELLLEVMTLPCPQTEEKTLSYKSLPLLLEKSKDFNMVAIGPGLSKNEETQRLAKDLVVKLNKPIILDADGLNAFSSHTNLFKKRKRKTIVTPHPGEMSRLTDLKIEDIQENRVEVTQEYAKKWNLVVVLKGYETVVADPGGRIIVNKSGGPALATAGTGDVLLGIIAAFWAQNLKKPFNSACTAVFLHGLAGDLAAGKLGEHSVIASDVIEYLPAIIRQAVLSKNARMSV
jgi:NAD(P)H-hydrate epimerase